MLVVDPACGAGNLLLAAGRRLQGNVDPRRRHQLRGYDISRRAVADCKRRLTSLDGHLRFSVSQLDFVCTSRRIPRRIYDKEIRHCAVLMNPPFLGYGSMARAMRGHLRSSYGVDGRYDLSHAFVIAAVRRLAPTQVVAVLPEGWTRTRSSSLYRFMSSSDGEWDWQPVDGEPFPGVDVRIGILRWRRARHAFVRRIRSENPPTRGGARLTERLRGTQIRDERVLRSLFGVEVRYGVATGADRVFSEIAELRPPEGRVLEAVRGRDVGRGSHTPTWLVPEGDGTSVERWIRARVGASAWNTLRARKCIESRGRATLRFHDSVPSWFLDHPKLILPEVIVGSLRVEFDRSGARFPLHSTVAIRAPDAQAAIRLREHLLDSCGDAWLRGLARLRGGSRRIAVSALRTIPIPDSLWAWWCSRYEPDVAVLRESSAG